MIRLMLVLLTAYTVILLASVVISWFVREFLGIEDKLTNCRVIAHAHQSMLMAGKWTLMAAIPAFFIGYIEGDLAISVFLIWSVFLPGYCYFMVSGIRQELKDSEAV